MQKPFASLIIALTIAAISLHAAAMSDQGDNPAFHRIKHVDSVIPPAGQLKDRLDDLISKANAGDNHAATMLYASLAACSTTRHAGDENAYSVSCNGVTQEQLDSRARWLKLAADRRYGPARYIYASSGITEALGGTSHALDHPNRSKHIDR